MNDITNGIFELIGGLVMVHNCLRLYYDKRVQGWNTSCVVFFASWGWWNLHYYPSLSQWWSFAGGVVMTLTHTAWVCMAVYYRRKELA